MAGSKWAQRIQFGQESTAGTAVAADVIWRGEGNMLDDSRETVVVPELIGVPMPSSRTYAGQIGGGLSMASTPATPEQLPHILEAGIKQVNSGSADGSASSGYTYTYGMSASSVNTISTYTIETGDDHQAEEMEYSFVQSFELAAVAGEAVMVSADWMGRQVQNASFTGALTPPAVTHLLSSNSTLYIDDVGGSFGGSAVSAGNILRWTLTVNTGWRGKWTVDSGNLYFNFHYYDRDSFDATLEIVFEHDSLAVTEKGKWRSNDARLVRIDVTGADYGTAGSGTTFSGKKGLRIDIPGRYTDFQALDSEDGNSIIVATLQGGYDETSGEVLELLVANEDSNLT